MRSDVIKKGAPAAPNRSLLYALGYTKEELERPLIGVVCSYNEIVPGHMNLDKIAEAVKAGIRAAGGTPVEFPAIAVCDGIAMGHVGMKYSLVTRDLIAASTAATCSRRWAPTTPASWTRPAWRSMKTTPAPPAAPAPACTPPTP